MSTGRARLPWPLPAVAAWLGAWSLYRLAIAYDAAPGAAIAGGLVFGALCSALATSPWRRVCIALGFPLALLLTDSSGIAQLAPQGWLLGALLLALLYPIRAWRDAPLFPTPPGALDGLSALAPLPPNSRILDAGCGLGHGLKALRRAYPESSIFGVEWSWPLRAWCGVRCPWARVHRGDLWHTDWSSYALVYLFQRPESMARAAVKAQAELAPGAWLVSLEFPIPGVAPSATVQAAGARTVWLYQNPWPPSADHR